MNYPTTNKLTISDVSSYLLSEESELMMDIPDIWDWRCAASRKYDCDIYAKGDSL